VLSVCSVVKPSRMKLPRLQFHLSTCIMLMFVAGLLLELNVLPRLEHRTHAYRETYGPWGPPWGREYNEVLQGWPVNFLDFQTIHITYIVVNIVAALAILAATAFACEWAIRRRRKKLDVSS